MYDCPYSTLKEDSRAYEIMLLQNQYGNTFPDLAAEYGISAVRVRQIYVRIKIRQIRLYIDHLAAALGHPDNKIVRQEFEIAYECYQNYTCACAYLEKKYPDILTAYRAGEPGMPAEFLTNLPPLVPVLRQETVAQIVKMKEVKKASYLKIAKELCITKEKARRAYTGFYHEKALEILRALQDKATNSEEKAAIWNYYFEHYRSSKKRYDALKQHG